MLKRAKQATRLEDYEPGASREEVMASLRKITVNLDNKPPQLKEEEGRNGKAN